LQHQLRPYDANVSNSVGLVPGSISGSVAYRRELTGQRARALRLAVVAGASGLTGRCCCAYAARGLSEGHRAGLIGVALVLVAVGPWLSRTLAAHRHAAADRGLPLNLTSTPRPSTVVTSRARGIIMIALLTIFVPDDLQRLNGLKNVLASLINGVAGILFIAIAPVHWDVVLLLATGAIVGGQIGARIGRRLPPALLRAVIICVGLAARAKLLLAWAVPPDPSARSCRSGPEAGPATRPVLGADLAAVLFHNPLAIASPRPVPPVRRQRARTAPQPRQILGLDARGPHQRPPAARTPSWGLTDLHLRAAWAVKDGVVDERSSPAGAGAPDHPRWGRQRIERHLHLPLRAECHQHRGRLSRNVREIERCTVQLDGARIGASQEQHVVHQGGDRRVSASMSSRAEPTSPTRLRRLRLKSSTLVGSPSAAPTLVAGVGRELAGAAGRPAGGRSIGSAPAPGEYR
jgi:uncharacterized membrane protein YfcA